MSDSPQQETPRQAYNRARAIEQKNHTYTTEGIHVVCSCGYVGTTETIAGHVEEYAETAGAHARDKVVAKLAAQHKAAEEQKKRAEAAALVKARAELEAQEKAQQS